MKIKVGVSARHVHLSVEDLELLFGKGYELTKFRGLTQPGQFAANEKVTIKTEAKTIQEVRVLGPARNYTQVEISKTDAYALKLNPPVRESGDLREAQPITIIGPNGEITKDCCIIASRHIHLTSEDRKKYNLEGLDYVNIKVEGLKGGIFNNVSLKESEDYAYELHIDCDDANSFMLKTGDEVEIINE